MSYRKFKARKRRSAYARSNRPPPGRGGYRL